MPMILQPQSKNPFETASKLGRKGEIEANVEGGVGHHGGEVEDDSARFRAQSRVNVLHHHGQLAQHEKHRHRSHRLLKFIF